MTNSSQGALDSPYNNLDIAIIGMAGRFPDAKNIDEFWQNISLGRCSIKRYSDQQLSEAGVDSATLADPDYVKVGIPFVGMAEFDAPFFGYSPKEAEQLDPQQRIFLQTCWHALEHAGIKQSNENLTGVFAGCGATTYLLQNLLSQNNKRDITSLLALANGNDKDSLATRVSYELNLKGPSVTVQTACSTSLVAVHMACRSLQNFDSDTAIAGGVWLNLAAEQGYHAPTGGSLSSSGQLSAFSSNADGILIGSGSAAVILKRVEDAIADGDSILAVIKGTAANNDGKDKIGYTAPSVTGQAAAIKAALDFADIEPQSIGYIEAHGTGTKLGDPIEIAALSQAYQAEKTQFCALGSVKPNIGHLDSAAGVTGLIKAVQALRHRQIPPSLYSQPANPAIDFTNSPFYVNTELNYWHSDSARRAAVSSLGMGGTNVHVILEEYITPQAEGHLSAEQDQKAPWHILPVSADSSTTLQAQVDALHQVIEHHTEVHDSLSLAQVAGQLQHKRSHLSHRKAFVVDSYEQVTSLLAREVVAQKAAKPQVALLFSGQGSQYVTMAQPLLKYNTAFKTAFTEAVTLFPDKLQQELHMVFNPDEGQMLAANQLLSQTRVTQPALFLVGYAMARTYQASGVSISAMLGHSIGEYVAACLADVMSLTTAINLVVARGEALEKMAPGAMLSVMADEKTIQPYLSTSVDFAAFNSQENTVVSGTKEAIKALQEELKEENISCTRLHVSHAFHSHLTESVLAEFTTVLDKAELSTPKTAFISNITGQWITAEQAMSTQYWLDHIRQPVRFAQGIDTLTQECNVLIEAGPGDTLQKLARHCLRDRDITILHSIAHVRDLKGPIPPFVKTLATLWQAGVELDWQQISSVPYGQTMILPEYCFSKNSYWVDEKKEKSTVIEKNDITLTSQPQLLAPVWQQAFIKPRKLKLTGKNYLLCASDHAICDAIALVLTQSGAQVTWLWQNEVFSQLADNRFSLDISNSDHLTQLTAHLKNTVSPICQVIDARFLVAKESSESQEQLAYSRLLPLVQWLAQDLPVPLTMLCSELFNVLGDEVLKPVKATLLGLTRVLPLEHKSIKTQVLEFSSLQKSLSRKQMQRVLQDLTTSDTTDKIEVAYRGEQRFILAQQECLPNPVEEITSGITFISGGLGGIGLHLAKYLASQGHSLILQTRSDFPKAELWSSLVFDVNTPDKQRAQLVSLLAIQEQNAQVIVISADVLDFEQLNQEILLAEQVLGTITHVIHAAGLPGGGFINNMDAKQAEGSMAAKVLGTDNLLKVFVKHELVHFTLCSSLASILGVLGQSDYCAANCYLDAIAQNQRDSTFPIVSINWDAWRATGMAAQYNMPEKLGFDGEEAAKLLTNIFSVGQVQIYASSLQWKYRVEILAELEQEFLSIHLPQPFKSGHARPELDTEYEPAESDLEHKLVALWQEFLGFEQIGIFDNLFALGGDSLIAIQMLARVKQQFSIELEPAEFFKEANIDTLAFIIEEKLLAELVHDN